MPYTRDIDTSERFLTFREAARILGMSYQALWDMRHRGQLIDEDGSEPFEKPPGRGPGAQYKLSYEDLKKIAHILRRKGHLDNTNMDLLITRIDLLATPVKFRTPISDTPEQRLSHLGANRKHKPEE